MTAKEYLNQAYRLNELIASNFRQIERLKSNLTNIVMGSFDGKVQGGIPTGFSVTCDKIFDLKKEIEEDSNRMASLLSEIRATIGKVSSADEKLLLSLRYLEFESWEEISGRMGYAERHALRIHGNALESVEKILKDVTKCH